MAFQKEVPPWTQEGEELAKRQSTVTCVLGVLKVVTPLKEAPSWNHDRATVVQECPTLLPVLGTVLNHRNAIFCSEGMVASPMYPDRYSD